MDWISVEDRLPEEGDRSAVLVKVCDDRKFVTHGDHPYMVISAWHVQTFPKMYTHWMPLPTPEAIA